MMTPIFWRSMPDSSRAFSAASVAASEGEVPLSQKRRAPMPETSSSRSSRTPSRSSVGFSFCSISFDVTRMGGSTAARAWMTTFLNFMGYAGKVGGLKV
jgi:hypothetical protein